MKSNEVNTSIIFDEECMEIITDYSAKHCGGMKGTAVKSIIKEWARMKKQS